MQLFVEIMIRAEKKNFLTHEKFYRYYSVFPFEISIVPVSENKRLAVKRKGLYEMIGIKKDTLNYKVSMKERFNRKEALSLFSLNFLKHALLADNFRREKLGNNYTGFVIDRNITFTNICTAACNFCAFWRGKKS